MKVKGFVGFLLALALGVCPCLMPITAAAKPSGAHSCCAPEGTSKHRQQPGRSGDDCCLRAPVQSRASISVPDLKSIFVALASGPKGFVPQGLSFQFDSAALSPPPDRLPSPSSSSRAPPARA
jgi:hypothetical protein